MKIHCFLVGYYGNMTKLCDVAEDSAIPGDFPIFLSSPTCAEGTTYSHIKCWKDVSSMDHNVKIILHIQIILHMAKSSTWKALNTRKPKSWSDGGAILLRDSRAQRAEARATKEAAPAVDAPLRPLRFKADRARGPCCSQPKPSPRP